MITRFADPQLLWLLLLVPLGVAWYWPRRGRKGATVRYSHLDLLRRTAVPRAGRARHVLFGLRVVALTALIVALARPQTGITGEEILTEGIDIVLVLDLSSSMLAEDLAPNRVEAAKAVAADFVNGRRNDRIGLVVFAGEAFTQAPLTVDYDIITSLMEQLEVGIIEDGTAIGMGIATAVKRLRDSGAESKVLIVLTDGRNNRGEIDPITAAQMAQSFGIRVYTVGAGTRGEAPFPVNDPVFGRRLARIRVDIDDDMLGQVATLTGGRYFRATDRASLEQIYAEIDSLETTEIEVRNFTRYGELFMYPLTFGLIVLLTEAAMANTALRKVP